MAIESHAVTFDSSDAGALADFWADVFAVKVNEDSFSEFASIGGPDAAVYLMFNQVPEGKKVKNRVHLDLVSTDLDGEVKRLEKLGATSIATITEGGRWTTMTDPQGNEFDVMAVD